MNDLNQDWHQVRETFKKIWGYEDFRPPQGEIVSSLLRGKDALIVLPTGMGKSICFQLPAILAEGLTVVVSPLVALMENQVQELRKLHLPAELLHSQLPRDKRKLIFQEIERQKLRLLYLSPETLLSIPVWEKLAYPQLKINGLILDEAHCLVQWGETFRPAYRRLGVVRNALLKSKPSSSKIAVAAFTATADPQSQKIISKSLELNAPDLFFISPYRENLNLKVQMICTPRGRKNKLLKFLQLQGKTTGLIYVRTRKQSEELATWLQSLGYQNSAYHAGLTTIEKRKIETNWLRGKIQFVVCTSAFGMGINKPDVRWVIHFQAPLLLSEYLQEIGRGGRDGKTTQTLTLISEPTGWLNPEDKQQRQFFWQQIEKQYQHAAQIARKIPIQGNIEDVSKKLPYGEFALAILNSMGKLIWLDPFHYQKSATITHQDLVKALETQKYWQVQMQQYLYTRKCRWQFLLHAFGYQQEATNFSCGHCDNCQKR